MMPNLKNGISVLQIACEMTELQGGPTRSALDLATYLPVEHIFAVVGKMDSRTFSLLNSSGISPLLIRSDFNNRSGFCFRDLPKLIGLIRSHDVTISHGFYTLPTLISCIVGREKSVYVMPHGSLEEYQWSSGKIKKILFDSLIKLTTKFGQLTFTVATLEESRSIKRKFKSNRVEVVGIGVDLPEFAKLQVKDEDSYISLLSISRIAPKKRIDTSIRALSLMEGTFPEPHLWIYGTGDLKLCSSLKRLALDLNVDEFVHFKGSVDHRDIAKVFSKTDILLLPSENENFAIAVAESIAHNVPVIVSRDVALSSFVEENLCGEVIESSDPHLLKEAILKVSSNLNLYRKACDVSRHKLGHRQVKMNWEAVLGIST
jgi:glycosyltransferase involved in cell wall biosynthesis